MSLHHVLDEWFETVVKPRLNKLDRIEAVEHHITGDPRDRSRGAGWEYVHVYIDDASRLAYSEVLRDKRKESAVPFLERALGWFAGYGVTVERVMTTTARLIAATLGGRRAVPLGCATSAPNPTPRAPTVRLSGSSKPACVSGPTRRPTPPPRRASTLLPIWLGHYDTARPHTALASRPPATRLGQNPFLGLIKGAVPSSRPGSSDDRSGGPGQGAPEATGDRPARCVLAVRRCGHARSRRDPCLMLSTTSLATTTRTVRRRHDSHETRL